MFGVSGAELLVILLAGLIVLGPDRLPEVARKAGKALGDLRRMSSGFEAEVRTALFEAEQPERYKPTSASSSIVDPPKPAAADNNELPASTDSATSTDSAARTDANEEPADARAGDRANGSTEPVDPA